MNLNKRQLTKILRAIADEVSELGPDGTPITNAEAVARKITERAKAGEPWAIQLFFDRLEGKATTPIEFGFDPPIEAVEFTAETAKRVNDLLKTYLPTVDEEVGDRKHLPAPPNKKDVV